MASGRRVYGNTQLDLRRKAERAGVLPTSPRNPIMCTCPINTQALRTSSMALTTTDHRPTYQTQQRPQKPETPQGKPTATDKKKKGEPKIQVEDGINQSMINREKGLLLEEGLEVVES